MDRQGCDVFCVVGDVQVEVIAGSFTWNRLDRCIQGSNIFRLHAILDQARHEVRSNRTADRIRLLSDITIFKPSILRSYRSVNPIHKLAIRTLTLHGRRLYHSNMAERHQRNHATASNKRNNHNDRRRYDCDR